MPIDLVILAGGRGKRISEFTKKIPKPLIKVNNICFFMKCLVIYYFLFCAAGLLQVEI